MIDFAHEEINLLLALLAFGSVLSGADEAREPSLTPGALEISKPMSLHPADLAVSPLNPVLMRVRLRIGGIERRLAVRPNPFRVVRMHPLHELLDRRLVSGKIENFLYARIHRDHAVERIVLPPPELGCVEGKLQTIFAVAQQILCCLPPDGGPPKLRHQRVDLCDVVSAPQHRAALSHSASTAPPQP